MKNLPQQAQFALTADCGRRETLADWGLRTFGIGAGVNFSDCTDERGEHESAGGL